MGEIDVRRIGGTLGTLVIVLVSLLVLAAPAGATHAKRPSVAPATGFPGNPTYQGFDPMETSVPYLAWRGEEVRLVKCLRPSAGEGPLSRTNLLAAEAEWQIMDWSGDDHVWPKFFDDVDQKTIAFTGHPQGDQAERVCWAIDITSHKPGIAVVKMKIDTLDPTFLLGEGDPVDAHQFNVIWMTLDQAILRNLGPGGGVGPITENPGDENQVGVVVKGAVPLNAQFRTELGAQGLTVNADSEIILPDAWPALARTTLASISRALRQANNGVDSQGFPNGEPTHVAGDFWDIHDSTGPYNPGSVYGGPGGNPLAGTVTGVCEVPPSGVAATHNASCHVSQGVVGGDPDCNGTSAVNDTVDNCNSGILAQIGPFSRVFHDVSGEAGESSTIGPYSPTRPDETLLSDSLLTIHDAPMPNALIRFRIDPNTGGADIGGVGAFSAKDKHVEYNRGGTGCSDPNNLHCITGPFNAAYIPPSPTMEFAGGLGPTFPAFDDRDNASGIHGPVANNFDGYLPVSYDPDGLGPAPNVQGLYHYWDFVEILRRAQAPASFPQECVNQGFDPPGGEIQEVYVYTDEHGEARIRYEAGFRFFPGAFDIDLQQRACVAEGLIGTARITAQAQYPNQPHTHAGLTSNEVTKRIESLFEKGIVCVPKTADPQAALCVVFARNFAGDPVTQEEVCVLIGAGINADVSGVQVLGPYNETRRLDRSACGELLAVTPPEAITDLFPAGVLPDAQGLPGTTPCGPSGDLDDYGFLVVKVDGRGNLKATAKFEDEFLERSCFFGIGPTGTIGGASVVANGGGGGGGAVTPNTNQSSGASLADGGIVIGSKANGTSSRVSSTPSGSGPAASGPAKAQRKASLLFVRIVKQRAIRSVLLRVRSSKATERVQLRLIGKRGKVLGMITRKVKTNRTIKVPNLRVPKAALNVRVKLIA